MTTIPSLIADIGGTNARFALADESGVRAAKTFQCEEYPTIVDAAKASLAELDFKPKHAAFAIAGPVSGDYFKMINHKWEFSVEETRKALGLDTLELMNDFKAIALGVPHLAQTDIRQIGGNQTPLPNSAIGIIGPGTGLGVASLAWVNGKYYPMPGEGGHITMPAKTQREFDLFQTLKDEKYSHVSAERVCSGKGLVNLYNAIVGLDGRETMPERTAEEISKAALEKTCPVSEEALDLMMGFLGTVASDLALTVEAKGGIYIAGGIPSKLGEYFFQSRFRQQFEDKGRFREYLEQIPTYLITHPNVAFLGLQHSVANGPA